MLSCNEICKALVSFENEQNYKFEHYNPLFEQSPDFSKKYLQLVEDKIKENGWIDPNLEPNRFKTEILPTKQTEKTDKTDKTDKNDKDKDDFEK